MIQASLGTGMDPKNSCRLTRVRRRDITAVVSGRSRVSPFRNGVKRGELPSG